ncbi:MAG: alkaline phosphatase family protein [Burkholderiaceae bacterium]
MGQIDHVFVLMLENRSFDHFFGLCEAPGVPRPTDPLFGPGASDRSSTDLPHEFADVQAQVAAGAMTGFSPYARLAFLPPAIPVVSHLAQEFLLFDNWHSSLSGPTWPNRFFVHAASSGGLAGSPSAFNTSTAVILPWESFKFQNGTVFDRIEKVGKRWRVYHGDMHPQVLALDGMVAKSFNEDLFRPLYPADHASDFAADLDSGTYDVDYTFIEPDYAIGITSQFADGDSQHPRGLVSAGEGLIKLVYESIRNSNIWEKSALLVVWDEHGGFYDHVKPPAATPPGDAPTNAHRAGENPPTFGFDTFGVRVPALLISPWVRKGSLGSTASPGKTFDHSSVISSLREQFALGEQITARDGAAPTWTTALSGPLRTGANAPPTKLNKTTAAPLAARLAGSVAQEPAVAPAQRPDPFIEGVALIALDLDRYVSQQQATQTIASEAFVKQVRMATFRTSAEEGGADFRLQLLAYIKQVDAKVVAHKGAMNAKNTR